MEIQIYYIFKFIELYDRVWKNFCHLSIEQSFTIDRFVKELKEVEQYLFQIADFKYSGLSVEEWIEKATEEYFHINLCPIPFDDIRYILTDLNEEEQEIFKMFFV